MTPTERLLKHLTRRPVADPRPEDWLVAADLLMDLGREKESLKWRRRGQWFPALLQAYETARALPRGAEVKAVAGGRLVLFMDVHGTICMFPCDAQGRQSEKRLWKTQAGTAIKGVPAAPKCNRKLLDVIDRLSAITPS